MFETSTCLRSTTNKYIKTKCDQQVEVVNKILPQNEYADVNLPCSSRVNLNYTNCGYVKSDIVILKTLLNMYVSCQEISKCFNVS